MLVLLLYVTSFQWTISECALDFYVVRRSGYDCLDYFSMHLTTPTKREYCLHVDDDEYHGMNEISNHRDQNYSFSELHEMNVTAMEIFLWSASIDLAEQYQYSLDHSTEIIASNDIFFNCTSPWFGPQCQYSFELNETQWLTDVDTNASASQYTCYTLLECDRGGPHLCLDWREICDGRIDCLNNGVDEAQCFDLELNKCNDNEYQCHNGLCLSKHFWEIDRLTVECLDQSDVRHKPWCPKFDSTLNLFDCEEYTCPPGPNRFSCGDGQCVEDFDECQNGRHLLLIESISRQGNLSSPCWLAMLCLTRMTTKLNETSCDEFFQSSDIIDYLHTCQALLHFPVHPLLNGHVHFLYRPHELSSRDNHSALLPKYICYDEHLCDFLVPSFRHDGHTCQSSQQLGLNSNREYPNWKAIIDAVKPFFAGCNIRYDEQVDLSLYRCHNSSKSISKRRIMDNIFDCYLNDDEQDLELSCSLNDSHRFQCPMERRCRAPSLRPFGCPSLAAEQYNVEKIAFSQLCDRYIDIPLHLIDGRNHSDETNCEDWPCKNMYTQCDGFWNCHNGIDEEHCRPSNCSTDSLACLSSSNLTMICLPARQVQNDIIDCLAGLDELQLCRTANIFDGVSYSLPCLNDTTCVKPSVLCNADESVMKSFDQHLCDQWIGYNHSELTNMLCPFGNLGHPSFTLSKSQTYPSPANVRVHRFNEFNARPSNAMHRNTLQFDEEEEVKSSSRCTRGIATYHYWPNKTYTSLCFCPPNYYGSTCQYQNQRVSLTLSVSAIGAADVYDLFVKLIDDDDNREEIHSYEQQIFVSSTVCSQSFDIYLLYSTRPKNLSKNYTIHIDVYDKTYLQYLASWRVRIPFLFLFLPVNRLAMEMTVSTRSMRPRLSCSLQCDHGICVKYINEEKFFCHCQTGWSGSRCQIPIDCHDCSLNSLCVGHIQHRSICICPLNTFGSRCLLKHSCPLNYCHNHGRCIVINARMLDESYLCVCTEQFYGVRCEHSKARLKVSLDQIKVSSYLLAYIYKSIASELPLKPQVTLEKLSTMQSSVTLYLLYSYQMVLIEVDASYYLAVLQEEEMRNISTAIDSTRRCTPINELLKVEQLRLPQIERIKLYHRLCRINPHRQCLFDESYMCLCTSEHYANCFLFTRQDNYQCYENIHCQNGGQCLQDRPMCPFTTICLCVDCFFGDRCQFYAKGIGLTLDDILRYEIRPHIRLSEQSSLIKLMIFFTIVLFVIGWINSLLSFLTFRRPKSREVGCGLYLFVLSIDYAVTVTVLFIKCCFVLLTQMNPSTNATILRLGCLFLEPFLKLCLWIGNWLNVCISVERAMTTSRGVYFNAMRSRNIAQRMIICLPIVVIVSSVNPVELDSLLKDVIVIQPRRDRCSVDWSMFGRQVKQNAFELGSFAKKSMFSSYLLDRR